LERRSQGHQLNLDDAACLASWPTPSQQDGPKGGPSQGIDRLPAAPQLAGSWATPAARDFRSDRGQKTDEEQYGTKGRPLPRQALLAAPGQIANGSPASTVKRAQLNPAHSRWLMGYRAVWDSCGAMAMQLLRKPRRNS
jgi:hypothetical protein